MKSEQKILGSLVTGIIAIGTILVGANQLVFTRSEGEALGRQVDRIEDRMGKGFDQIHEDMRIFFGHHSAKNTSMAKPSKKNSETALHISDEDYQALRARARKESGHEFFSWKDSFGEDQYLKYNSKSQGGH